MACGRHLPGGSPASGATWPTECVVEITLTVYKGLLCNVCFIVDFFFSLFLFFFIETLA